MQIQIGKKCWDLETCRKSQKNSVFTFTLSMEQAMHDDAFINANMWGVILSAVEEKKVWLFD